MLSSYIRQNLINLLFPQNILCPLCQRSLHASETTLCAHCEDRLAQNRLTALEQVKAHDPLRLCISAFAYDGAAQKLIHQLKYGSNPAVAPVLAQHMCAALLETNGAQGIDAVVPVPLHPIRLRQRGFNQAQLLAQEVAHCFGLPLRPDLLQRKKQSLSQTTRTATERRIAMRDAFAAGPEAAGRNILLVDDVLTTGATAISCAEALLAADAAQVTLLTACQA